MASETNSRNYDVALSFAGDTACSVGRYRGARVSGHDGLLKGQEAAAVMDAIPRSMSAPDLSSVVANEKSMGKPLLSHSMGRTP